MDGVGPVGAVPIGTALQAVEQVRWESSADRRPLAGVVRHADRHPLAGVVRLALRWSTRWAAATCSLRTAPRVARRSAQLIAQLTAQLTAQQVWACTTDADGYETMVC